MKGFCLKHAQGLKASQCRVRTGHGNPGKSWNFFVAFSRTGKSWKINAGSGKSWKSINSYKKNWFKKNWLQYYFWNSIS